MKSNNLPKLLCCVLLLKKYSRVEILIDCPSAAPFGFALGPPNPWLNTIAKETLDFRCAGLSPAMRLLRPTFSLPSAPQSVTLLLQCPRNASLPLTRIALCAMLGNSKFEFRNSKLLNLFRISDFVLRISASHAV